MAAIAPVLGGEAPDFQPGPEDVVDVFFFLASYFLGLQQTYGRIIFKMLVGGVIQFTLQVLIYQSTDYNADGGEFTDDERKERDEDMTFIILAATALGLTVVTAGALLRSFFLLADGDGSRTDIDCLAMLNRIHNAIFRDEGYYAATTQVSFTELVQLGVKARQRGMFEWPKADFAQGYYLAANFDIYMLLLQVSVVAEQVIQLKHDGELTFSLTTVLLALTAIDAFFGLIKLIRHRRVLFFWDPFYPVRKSSSSRLTCTLKVLGLLLISPLLLAAKMLLSFFTLLIQISTGFLLGAVYMLLVCLPLMVVLPILTLVHAVRNYLCCQRCRRGGARPFNYKTHIPPLDSVLTCSPRKAKSAADEAKELEKTTTVVFLKDYVASSSE